jgi:hypothetical protein
LISAKASEAAMAITIKVNGVNRTVDVDGDTLSFVCSICASHSD